MRLGLGLTGRRAAVAVCLALSLVACGGDGTGPATAVTLPSGDACADEYPISEPHTFDALVAVLGDGITLGRSATVTVCAVPDRGARAVVALSATEGARLETSTIEWPRIEAGRRVLGKVSVTVPDGVLAKVTAHIVLYDANGEGAGAFLKSIQLLGGPDAVFSSTETVSDRPLRELALLRELRTGRLSEDEYRQRLDRLHERGPDATLTPVG